MNISEQIKNRRKELGLTVKTVCENSGLKKSFYYFLENGERKPSFSTLEKLCEPLKCDFETILIPKK